MPESFGAGRFRIVRTLGESTGGAVYEAHDAARGVRVALKTLRDGSQHAVARFKREFRAAQEVSHPGLVALHELFVEGDVWFFTMDLVEGVDLLSYVRPPNHPLGFDEARLRSVLVQLARALGALHARGRVHRDVKPSNVLVRPDGRLVLLDFGFVTDRDASLSQDRILGTPHYMAPEQGSSATVGPEADLYAVGVILFESLTGKPPFDGVPLAILFAKQTQSAVSPRASEASAPEDLDALCLRLLARTPSDRPAVGDVLRALAAEGVEGGGGGRSLVPLSAVEELDGELALVARAFEETQRGSPVTVLIEGPAGVRNAALVQRSLASLNPASTIVLRGRCHVRETSRFKGIDSVLESYAAYLGGMAPARVPLFVPTDVVALVEAFPLLLADDFGLRAILPATFALAFARWRPLKPAALRIRAMEAVRDAFTRLANAVYVVIVIEDLQWADSETLALLATLLDPLRAPPVLFLATVRTGAQGEEAGAKAVDLPGDVRRIALRG